MNKLVLKNHCIDEGKPIICVPIVKVTKEEILAEAKILAEKSVEMIEWRVDWYENAMSVVLVQEILEELKNILEDTILLFTFRTKEQGGEIGATEAYLKELYDMAAASGVVDMIDVEYFAYSHPDELIKTVSDRNVAVICSHHNFNKTPSAEEMYDYLQKMAEGEADIVKLAVMPENLEDVLNLLSVTAEFKKKNPQCPVVTMSMGALGMISRISGETFGSCITFGSHDKPSAPGQLQMEQLGTILDYLHEAGKR